MKIPRSIKIGQSIIKVKYQKDLEQKEKSWGVWHPNDNTIMLHPPGKGDEPVSQHNVERHLIHELTHAMLEYCGRSDLSNKHALVDPLSNLFHQVITQLQATECRSCKSRKKKK